MRKFTRIFTLPALALGMMVLTAGLAVGQPENSTSTIVLVSFREETSKAMRFVVLVQKEAFRRLGYETKFLFVPGKRASEMAENGLADGEMGRPETYGSPQSNLIRVEEDCGGQQVMAYTMDPDLKLNGWDSLRGTSLHVEYQRGMSTSMRNLVEIVRPELLSEVSTTEQGLKRLVLKRTDVYIDANMGTTQVLQSADFQVFEQVYGKGARVQIAGTMGEISLYPWLHRKHADLVPRLAKVLREMKADGSFERYAKEVGGSRNEFRW